MPVTQPTLLSIRTSARDRLNESTASFWPDAALNRWINEGARDIARRAEVIQSFNTTIAAVVNTGKYALPVDVIRVHRVEFVPTGSSQTYPVQHSTYQEADQLWGINQSTPSSYPLIYVIWGVPGSPAADAKLEIQFFPVPSQTGTFNIFYYRFPNPAAADGDVVEVPIGWDDAVIAYVEYMARRRDHDPDWQVAKQEYEDKVQQMVDVTRQWHDQQRMIITARATPVPMWLYGDEWS